MSIRATHRRRSKFSGMGLDAAGIQYTEPPANRRQCLSDPDIQPRLKVEPLGISLGLRQQACEAIKRAIMAMDLYGQLDEIKLDERQLSQDLGVSRTPIREALSVLEQEGFVRSIPRRGIRVELSSTPFSSIARRCRKRIRCGRASSTASTKRHRAYFWRQKQFRRTKN